MNISKAEMELVEEAKKMEIWKMLHLNDWKQCVKDINLCLIEGSDVSYEKLINIIKDKETLDNYLDTSEFAYMVVIVSIYEEEKVRGIEKTIFSMNKSIDDLINYIAKIKFWIWRLEFGEDEKDNTIIEEEASCVAVECMLRVAAFDKVKASYLVSLGYRKMGRDVDALKILFYANSVSNDERILCEIADIYIKYGKVEESMQYVKMIERPTKRVEKYMDKWEKEYAK